MVLGVLFSACSSYGAPQCETVGRIKWTSTHVCFTSEFPETPRLGSIAIAIILAAAIVGLVVRKPLLVTYHRNAMAEIWQTELGISPRKGLAASIRSLVGVAPGPSNPGAAGRALLHRDALLRLGFFTNRTFSLAPLSVGTPDYQQLCDRVARQSGQLPIAGFVYDRPHSPSNVLGLIVYAPPEDMPRWEQFVTDLTKKNE